MSVGVVAKSGETSFAFSNTFDSRYMRLLAEANNERGPGKEKEM